MSFDNLPPEERSRLADALLDNPFLQYVLDTMELKYVEAWRTSSHDEWDKRDQAYQRLNALHEFRADLELIATESAIRAFNRRSREVI